MFLKIIILGILSLNIGQALDKPKSCSKLLRFYADGLKDFLLCSMQNSVPVHLCFNCSAKYQVVLERYDIFLNGEDKNGDHNEKCYKKFIDQDRLNIVLKNHNYFENLWKEAYCSECFSGKNMKNSTDINNMFQKLSTLKTCINNSMATGPCNNCSEYYNSVNIFYNNLITKHKNQICFDIQDEMNRTRLLWSKTLKCSKNESDILSFAAIVTTISCLPILFYSFLYFYTKRNENSVSGLYGNIESNSSQYSINSLANSTDVNNIENVEEEGAVGGSDNVQNVTSSREAPEGFDEIEYLKTKNKSLKTKIDDNDDEPILPKLRNDNLKASTSKKLIKLSESESEEDEVNNILGDDNKNKISSREAPEGIDEIKYIKTKNKSLKSKVDDNDDEPILPKLRNDNLKASTSKKLIKLSESESEGDEVNNILDDKKNKFVPRAAAVEFDIDKIFEKQ